MFVTVPLAILFGTLTTLSVVNAEQEPVSEFRDGIRMVQVELTIPEGTQAGPVLSTGESLGDLGKNPLK